MATEKTLQLARFIANRMTTALAVGVTLSVSVAVAVASWMFVHHHERHALRDARSSAEVHSNLIQLALEHQMLEDERALTRKMIVTFGQDPGVKSVMLLDRLGRVQMSSRAAPETIDANSATCRACHDKPADQRTDTVLLETEAGQVLRSVRPIHNREECHSCHEPQHQINGVLIVDFDLTRLQAGLAHEVWIFGVGAASLALFLIGTIALLVRIVVTRRLARVERGARDIAGGDLKLRLPETGGDTVAWLAKAFNALAAKGDALVTQVGEQRQQLEDILNGVDDGIVVLDANLLVVAANSAFLSRHHASRSATLGHSCTQLGAGICSAERCPARGSFQSGEHRTEVLAAPGPDGKPRYEEVRSSPLRRPDGSVGWVVEVWRDITERRAAEARMADGHRMASLGLLASGFSHEINTPLATTLTCLDGIRRMLADPETSPEDVDNYLRVARGELLRCRGITQQFLALSRGERGAKDIVDLCAAVEAMVKIVAPTAKDRGLELRSDVCALKAFARIGEATLQQVVLNLLLNAVQASQRGGVVQVRGERGDGIALHVDDQGCGIGAEAQRHIFEPFFSGRTGGTGLGLFLALEAAHSWGGSIAVTSTPGQGSRFTLHIPASALIVEAEQDAQDGAQDGGLDGAQDGAQDLSQQGVVDGAEADIACLR